MEIRERGRVGMGVLVRLIRKSEGFLRCQEPLEFRTKGCFIVG